MPRTPKKYRPPERPRLRRLFKSKRPAWLVLEPRRLARIAGALVATLTLLVLYVRQLQGVPYAPPDIVFWVALSFVVAYAAAGAYVLLLLHIAERELPEPEVEPLIWHGHSYKPVSEVPEEDVAAVEQPAPEPPVENV